MARPLPSPQAVLFDLFHTLVSVPSAGGMFGPPLAEALGMPEAAEELQRRYHGDDVLGRCVGRIRDPHEILRTLARGIDPSVTEERIAAALAIRRRRFEHGLVSVEPAILAALDRLRAAGIRIALVSDAGYDDVESWLQSPLRARLDATVFSYEVGVRKPDPRIYRHALAAIDVPARDALFVGDGGSDEHRGARAVGMGAVLVTRLMSHWATREQIDSKRPQADWEFSDVPEFVETLLNRPSI